MDSNFADKYLGSTGARDYFKLSGLLISYDGSGLADNDTPAGITPDGFNMELIAVDAGQAYFAIRTASDGYFLFESSATRGPGLTDITPTGVDTGAPWSAINWLGASDVNRYFEFVNSDFTEFHIYEGDGRSAPTAVQLQETVATPFFPSAFWLAAFIAASLTVTVYYLRRQRC